MSGSSTGRGQKLLSLCASAASRSGKHVLVKILETDEIVVCNAKDLQQSKSPELYIYNHKGKVTHAIIIHSKDKANIEELQEEIIKYERNLSKYRSLGSSTQSVQTVQIETSSVQSQTELLVPGYDVNSDPSVVHGECRIPLSHMTDVIIESIPVPPATSPQDEIEGDPSVVHDECRIPLSHMTDVIIESIPVPPATSPQDEIEVEPNIEEGSRYGVYEVCPITNVLLPIQPQDMMKPNVEEGSRFDAYEVCQTTNELLPILPQDTTDPSALHGECSIPLSHMTDVILKSTPPPAASSQGEIEGISQQSQNFKKGKNRPQHCIFCKRNVFNLPRHLLLAHKSEDRVKEYLALPVTDPKRGALIANIRHEGNALLNKLLQEEGKSVVPVRAKNRPQHCIFCKRNVFNLPQHLLLAHKAEDRVKEYLTLPLTDPKRGALIASIRREGNYLVNKVLQKEGISVSSVTTTESTEQPQPCPNCGAFYGKKTLARHLKRCNSTIKVQKNFISVIEGKSKTSKYEGSISVEMKTIILPGMRSLIDTILQDFDIVEFGNSQCLKHGHEIDKQKNLIRQKLRRLAQLKIEMAKLDPSITSMRDIFNKDKWDYFITALSTLGKLESKNMSDKSPNVVNQMGMLACNLAKDIEVDMPNTESGKKEREVIQYWIKKYERKFNTTIGAQASKVAEKKKWENRHYQPVAEDIMRLTSYLKRKLDESMEELKTKFSLAMWEQLNQSVMLMLLIFNRKRVGEIRNLTLEDFSRKEKVQKNTDIYKSLNPSEKILATRFFHVLIRGKQARAVPLLIGEKEAEAIDCLIKLRSKAKVSPDNPNLFGKGLTGKFNTNTTMTDAAFNCGAEAPELLTSSKLRRHIGSVAQAMQMTDNEVKVLCGFLGHNKDTHLEHYRMPSDALHTAKISKLLMALDSGTISNYSGKTINDIDVDVPIGNFNEKEKIVGDAISFMPLQIETEKNPTTAQASHLLSIEIPSTSKSTAELVLDKGAVGPVPSGSEYGPSESDLTNSPEKTPKKLRGKKQLKSPSPKKKSKLPWTTPEKRAMRAGFEQFLQSQTLPSFRICNDVKKNFPVLKHRRVVVMKAWVNNQIVKHKKKKN